MIGFGMRRIEIGVETAPEQWLVKIQRSIAGESDEPPSMVKGKEAVKISCKYCGSLVDPVTEEKCSYCGAPSS